ncbi:MAG: SidA/IucD/PvdA family monooxygenase [Rhizomicrobium sp.]
MTIAPSRRSIVAVGAGPSNLSLAALAHPLADVDVILLERKKELRWHADQLVGNARMQTNALKDLVTLMDPESAFSFLAYLKDKRRLYRAIVRGLDHVTRAEFEDYLRWAAEKLSRVHLGEEVGTIGLEDGMFSVETGRQTIRTSSVVLGIGRSPAVPPCARPRLGQNVFHCADLLSRPRSFAGRRVVVVGGGQSGAEAIHELLKNTFGAAASLHWITRRPAIFALEDSAFVNEWFFPQHSIWFHRQAAPVRQRMLEAQDLASDGVSAATLSAIYDLLYARSVGRGSENFDISVNTSLEAMSGDRGAERMLLRDCLTGGQRTVEADVVILCTGFEFELPRFLEGLRPRLRFDDTSRGSAELALREDFSVMWDGPASCRLFVQNGGLNQHGIADPNLSLIAWRSGKILNAILGRTVFDCAPVSGALNWFDAAREPDGAADPQSAARAVDWAGAAPPLR